MFVFYITLLIALSCVHLELNRYFFNEESQNNISTFFSALPKYFFYFLTFYTIANIVLESFTKIWYYQFLANLLQNIYKLVPLLWLFIIVFLLIIIKKVNVILFFFNFCIYSFSSLSVNIVRHIKIFDHEHDLYNEIKKCFFQDHLNYYFVALILLSIVVILLLKIFNKNRPMNKFELKRMLKEFCLVILKIIIVICCFEILHAILEGKLNMKY